jgi:ABC-type glutathione transport system ATPase component
VADRIVRIRDGRVSEEWAREDDRGDTIVVGRGGWLRLPEELLLRAGIGARATARLDAGAVVVERAGDAGPGPHDVGGTVSEAPFGAPSAAGAGTVVASVRGLRKAFGETRVLDGLDAEFRGGRLHTVTGPSGSGKTTFLHLLAGLEPPDAG